MKNLQVWARNALSVELVKGDTHSFVPPILLERTTVLYRGATISGYWQLSAPDRAFFPSLPACWEYGER